MYQSGFPGIYFQRIISLSKVQKNNYNNNSNNNNNNNNNNNKLLWLGDESCLLIGNIDRIFYGELIEESEETGASA